MSLASSSFTGQALAFRPAVQRQQRSPVAQVVAKQSRIGKLPIVVPDKVQVTLDGNTLKVKGPKGELNRTFPELVTIEQEGNVLKVLRVNETRQANCLHGLSRSLLNSMVVGVSDGFTKTLSLIGVGYKAAVNGQNLTLNLGYSHPIEMPVPKGLEVKVEKNTTVIVSGFDKELVGQFAADVRSKREPEPYKGKGVRYVDEYVRRKEGKRGK
ncbi:hypothetical protein Ndes2437B_g01127 [Nannochloris sp. 'desiccata']|nr:hypothetical protein KSW81_006238 [Chlorella desiccata (nom. nud.)]KAG7674674.1 hypothetical protein KSW81_000317 [Chlorella desiccata (nom. nud.)]